MKTVSVNVMNLCVPCHCHCRYCLLSWNGKITGINYSRSEAYAQRFHNWIQSHRPDLSFGFYFGYSMDHPQLLHSIDFMRSIGSPGGDFLQFDGMRMRTPEETEKLLLSLRSHNIRLIDLTFYGLRDHHDSFAGRPGDFDFLFSILECANRIGLAVQIGIPLTQENVHQANTLHDLFSTHPLQRFRFFIPHAEGRGETLNPVRLKEEDLSLLQTASAEHFNHALYHTPAQWLELLPTLPKWENRTVTIALTPQAIDALESEDFSDTIAHIEMLDDVYHTATPSTEELLALYADPSDTRLYSRRDVIQSLQRRYIREHGLKLYDVHDERQSFVRRH